MPSYRGPRYRVIRQIATTFFFLHWGAHLTWRDCHTVDIFLGASTMCVCVCACAITGDSLGPNRSSPTPPSPHPDSRSGGGRWFVYITIRWVQTLQQDVDLCSIKKWLIFLVNLTSCRLTKLEEHYIAIQAISLLCGRHKFIPLIDRADKIRNWPSFVRFNTRHYF